MSPNVESSASAHSAFIVLERLCSLCICTSEKTHGLDKSPASKKKLKSRTSFEIRGQNRALKRARMDTTKLGSSGVKVL